jgi:DedD protein
MMERALKERIIGAVVLVVFVVLVVPIFLDGPPADGEVVTERVLLPGQDDQKTQTVVLDRDRTDPVPAARLQQEQATPQEQAPPQDEATLQDEAEPAVIRRPEPSRLPPKPAPDTPREEQPAEEPATSSTGMWAVQLGSFSNRENAERLAADLRKQGYAAFLSRLDTGSATLHRVRIGPQKDRDGAEAMAERLARAGHDGQVVPHP